MPKYNEDYHTGWVEIYKQWWPFHEALLDSGLLAVSCSGKPSEPFNFDLHMACIGTSTQTVFEDYSMGLQRSMQISFGLFLNQVGILEDDYFKRELFFYEHNIPTEISRNQLLSSGKLPQSVLDALPDEEGKNQLLETMRHVNEGIFSKTKTQNRAGNFLQINLAGMSTATQLTPVLVGMFGEDFHPRALVAVAGVDISQVTGVLHDLSYHGNSSGSYKLVGDHPHGIDEDRLRERHQLGQTQGCPFIPQMIAFAQRVKADFAKHVLEPYHNRSDEEKAKLGPEENRVLSGQVWEEKKGEGEKFRPPKTPPQQPERRGGKK